MRKKGISREETNKKIIEAVGRGFRKNGVAGIGVDGLAKLANVTSGAFYSHLGSKNKAFKIALEAGLDEVIVGISKFQKEDPENWIENFSNYYLSSSHQKDFECGCAMATLTGEVTRFSQDIHKIYEKKMEQIVLLIAKNINSDSGENKKAKAWSFLSILIGGLNVVRAIDDVNQKESVSKAIINSAIKTLKSE